MVVVAAAAGTMTAFAVWMVAAAGRMVGLVMTMQHIVTSQVVRGWHMDPKVVSALRTSCAATATEAGGYKRQDAEVELEKRGSCMMYVGEASLVAMVGASHSASSSKQMTLPWMAANGVVGGREVWCRAEAAASQWQTVVEPLPVLPTSRVPNVVQKRKT